MLDKLQWFTRNWRDSGPNSPTDLFVPCQIQLGHPRDMHGICDVFTSSISLTQIRSSLPLLMALDIWPAPRSINTWWNWTLHENYYYTTVYIYIFKWEATLEALPEAPWISWTERWDWTKGLRRWSYFFVKIWSGKHGACIHFSDQKAGNLLLLTGTETQFLL